MDAQNTRCGGATTARNGVYDAAWRFTASLMGFVKMPIKANDNLTITETYLEKGDCVIKTERHLMAVVGGVVRDTLDSRFKRKPNARKRNAKLYHSPVLEVWAKPDRKHPVELTEELDGEYPRWTDTIAKEVTCNLIIRCQDREGNLDSESRTQNNSFWR